MQSFNSSFPQPQGGQTMDQPMSMPMPMQHQQTQSNQVFSLTNESTNQDTSQSASRYIPPSLNVLPQLPIRDYEVASHYMYRKIVYDNVFAKIKDHDKAICYSNIWYNITYLGNKYSKTVEETVMRYAPLNFVPPKLPEMFSNQDSEGQGSNRNYEGSYQRR